LLSGRRDGRKLRFRIADCRKFGGRSDGRLLTGEMNDLDIDIYDRVVLPFGLNSPPLTASLRSRLG
jgi:hypothetical protein